MLVAHVTGGRHLGSIDYICEEDAGCRGETYHLQSMFRDLQSNINRFYGHELSRPIVVDGVIGWSTVEAIRVIAAALNLEGALTTIAVRGATGALLAAYNNPGALSPAWVAYRAKYLLTDVMMAAVLLKRPFLAPETAAQATTSAAPCAPLVSAAPSHRAAWWIGLGIGLVALTAVVTAVTLRPRQRRAVAAWA